MFDSKLLWSGRISTKLEVAERLEEITPFSTSKLQRTMKIGYGCAAHIVDLFEMLGIVSAVQDSRRQHIPLMSSREAVFTLIRYLHATLPASDDEANTLLQEDEDSDFADTEIVCLFEEESVFFEENDEESDLIISVSHEESPCRAAPELSPADQLRQAVETACARERIGTSVLQRALKIGYGRAAALINRLEEMGVVGPDPGDKTGRPVLLSYAEASPLAEAWIAEHFPDKKPGEDNEGETDGESLHHGNMYILAAEGAARRAFGNDEELPDPDVMTPALADIYRKALELTTQIRLLSDANLYHRLGISYARAICIVDQFRALGILEHYASSMDGYLPIIPYSLAVDRLEAWLEQQMQS